MSDVTRLPRGANLVLVCNCGCSTFQLLGDKTQKCAACGSNVVGDWTWFDNSQNNRDHDSDRDAEKFGHVKGMGEENVNFARRRMAQIASDPNNVLIATATAQGKIAAWALAETEEQVDWTMNKLDEIKALVADFVEKQK